LTTTKKISLDVPEEHSGIRLDRFLAIHVASQTRSQIQRLIKHDLASVNGRVAQASRQIHTNDTVILEIPPPRTTTLTPEALPLDIVYDDADLLVVNKPAGMVVHPSAGHFDGTLVHGLLHHVKDLSGIGGERRPGIVHRLDRGTSGLIVVAKNDLAHVALAQQFKDRKIEKEYIALVWGVVQQGRRIDLPIGRDPVDRKKISTRARRTREAVTRIAKAEQLDGVSLLHVAIITGRTHQIRVHLSGIGHPIVGDSLYGGVRRHPAPHLRVVQRLERPFLHAHRLSFTHPRDARPVELNCPLPDDLQFILDAVRSITVERREKHR